MRRRLAVVTIGCKANFTDSAEIAALAARAGLRVVSETAGADILIINSCTVTHRADRDSRALARRLRRQNPEAVIVMTGCYARTTPGDRACLPEVNHWFGNDAMKELPRLFGSLSGESAISGAAPSLVAVNRLLGRTRVFLKIQDGCDSACAYCIVPKARGPGRSVPLEKVMESIRRAEQDGAREIVLTGIHAGRYGADRGETDGLAVLLEKALTATSVCRFRLGSVEPLEITPRLVERIAVEKRICTHIHVPMQSGSDAVLQRMRRPYTFTAYREKLLSITSAVPEARLGADVIVGFPGESERDFTETLDKIRELPLSYLHVFPYSTRTGTESASWADDVGAAEKKRRASLLLAADKEMRGDYAKAQVGKTLSVIAESENAKGGNLEIKGLSENYLEVVFSSRDVSVGDIAPVRILSARNGKLEGSIVSDSGKD